MMKAVAMVLVSSVGSTRARDTKSCLKGWGGGGQ